MTYFAAAVVRGQNTWTGREVDLAGLEDLEDVAEVLRDLDGATALLLLEQDDEWLGLVRVDGDDDPRVFLSDRRAVQASEIAALLWESDQSPPLDGDEDEEGTPAAAEPVGDAALLLDLGIAPDDLLELCAEEGMLPGDVLSALGERVGFASVLDDLREA